MLDAQCWQKANRLVTHATHFLNFFSQFSLCTSSHCFLLWRQHRDVFLFFYLTSENSLFWHILCLQKTCSSSDYQIQDFQVFANENFCLLNSTISDYCPSRSYRAVSQFTTVYYSITSLKMLICPIASLPNSIILCILFLGNLCNLFAICTFCQPNSREMGGGIYRLWISIVGQVDSEVVVSYILLQWTRDEIF